ncbi:MAG: PilZ domain-containing protein [Psychrosphaera sp.]|nr:PilZ domain-containing protein [Psychrosphaera sp.]
MSTLPQALLEVTYGLVPVFGRDDFDDLFEQVGADYTVGEQYQVKNELNRICEPCEKVMDLRGEIDGKCVKFIHNGRIHYLDDTAIETFNAGLEHYGQFTIGIWEEVNNTGNNFRVLQAKAEQEKLNLIKAEQQRKADKLQHILATKLQYSDNHYPVHVIHFGDYFSRGEERMNYSVSATLTFADGRQMEAVTKDLSINGTYLRVPLSETVEMDELVHVKMQGQSKAYNGIVGQGIEYQVKRIEFIDRVIWLGLNRTFSEKKGDFTDYVKDLIICNKFVYKVNLDNAIDAALKQGH